MPQFLFDTDHLSLYEHGLAPLVARVAALPPNSVALSPATVEEALRGRLARLARPLVAAAHVRAYAEFIATLKLVQQFWIVPFDMASENTFQHLRSQRLRVGTRDLKIGAVALANQLTVLTRNRRDFSLIPGLTLVDWSV